MQGRAVQGSAGQDGVLQYSALQSGDFGPGVQRKVRCEHTEAREELVKGAAGGVTGTADTNGLQHTLVRGEDERS